MKVTSAAMVALLNCAAIAQLGTPWEQRWHPTAPGPDEGKAICADKFGNYFVAGSTSNEGTTEDILVVSYDAAGNFRWRQRYDNPGFTDKGVAIQCDDNGDVIVAGESDSATGVDFVVWKLAGDSGVQRWNPLRITSSGARDDRPTDLFVTPAGDIYVTGTSETPQGTDANFLTARISPDGQMVWSAPIEQDFSGRDDWAAAIVVHTDGSITVGGTSQVAGQVDTSDWALVRYNGNGTVMTG